jgi:hypothetical protein
MKTYVFLLAAVILSTSCQKESIEPDVVENVNVTGNRLLLSGGTTRGKDWIMASFIHTQNWCTPSPTIFKSQDILDLSNFERDNTTTIFPTLKVNVDEGATHANYYSPQLHVGGQQWYLLQENLVLIKDLVAQPSLNGTWDLTVTESTITLKMEERDSAFKGSIDQFTVTFTAAASINK